jgi:putative ABC transport system substrate-binding protein
LRELGWVEGGNLTIGFFWATGRENMEAAARELLASDPDVIVTQEFMVFAMQSLKTAKPVVFGFSGDPVEGKLVQSWPRPGGNFTGMSYLALELVGKRIELLKEWLPQTQRVAILARPQHPGEHLERKASEAVVGKLGIELCISRITQPSVPARSLGELETAFPQLFRMVGCAGYFSDSVTYGVSGRIAQFALDAKLPLSQVGLHLLARAA